MAVNLFQEIVKNKFLLILLGEKEYLERIEEIIRSVEREKTRRK